MKGVAIAIAAGIAAAGCGGGSASFAGMSRDEALLEAHNAAAYEVNSRSSDVYGAEPALSRLVQSSNRVGDDAWLAIFEQQGRPRLCIWLWSDDTPLGGRINTEAGECEAIDEDADGDAPA